MQHSTSILILACAATSVVGHGVITGISGANKVDMPGLSVIDGTPRDCASPSCGAEADTSIIRGKAQEPLGRTKGGGVVTAAPMISVFMDGGAGNNSDVQLAREVQMAKRTIWERSGGGGVKTPEGTVETGVKAATGAGASTGLPTAGEDGSVTMTFHLVNEDGGGPLTASIDPTSGGTDATAFKEAAITTNVPGIGIGGLITAKVMDFPVVMQMPAGMTCAGTVAGVNNVCVAKLQNAALAGPFGGSVVFTQTPEAKKRAIEYNMVRRRINQGLFVQP